MEGGVAALHLNVGTPAATLKERYLWLMCLILHTPIPPDCH